MFALLHSIAFYFILSQSSLFDSTVCDSIYRDTSISRLATSWIFDKPVIRSGSGYNFGGFIHVESDPAFDKLDIFRMESELTKARKTANALRTAHSRPFNDVTPPKYAPAKKYRSRKKSDC